MASFRGHAATAAVLGVGYGSLAYQQLEMPMGAVILAAGLTTLGGLLPDLDSDSSVPSRTMFKLFALAVILLGIHHLLTTNGPIQGGVIFLAGIYVAVRYFLAHVFRQLTKHRGMYHSLPAMAIAGLIVYLLYSHFEEKVRIFLAGGIMLGFLSHLVLDEICAVDFQGARFRKPFGTAVKLFSPSWIATTFTYSVLFTLAYLAFHS